MDHNNSILTSVIDNNYSNIRGYNFSTAGADLAKRFPLIARRATQFNLYIVLKIHPEAEEQELPKIKIILNFSTQI